MKRMRACGAFGGDRNRDGSAKLRGREDAAARRDRRVAKGLSSGSSLGTAGPPAFGSHLGHGRWQDGSASRRRDGRVAIRARGGAFRRLATAQECASAVEMDEGDHS
jgi:hypothetical protein